MNVLKPDKLLNKLKEKGFDTDIYYFASPKIKSSREIKIRYVVIKAILSHLCGMLLKN